VTTSQTLVLLLSLPALLGAVGFLGWRIALSVAILWSTFAEAHEDTT
jgi:hypothetical protein